MYHDKRPFVSCSLWSTIHVWYYYYNYESLLRIEAAKRGKEKERLTWSCYLKTKTMVMEGWLTNVTFFPSTSVFRSLHLCSCFSLLVFSLFFFFFLPSLVPSVSLCSCSSWYLSVLSVFVHFVCVFFFFVLSVCGSPLFRGLSLFVLVSLGLYLVGWINNLRWGEVEVPFCWRKVTSLCVFFMSLFFPPCLFVSVCCGLYRARECPFISPGIVWRLARSCHAWEKKMPITGLLGAHCGGEILDRDVTMIYCRFCWIGGMKEMNSLRWNGVVFTWKGYFNFSPRSIAIETLLPFTKTIFGFQFN